MKRPAMAPSPKAVVVSPSAPPSRRLNFKQPEGGSANAASSQSSPIFVTATGTPMAFYVPPCDNGGELRRLITAGGGKVAEKSSKDVINLIPEGLQHKKTAKA
mmetsp:Transcript_40160/g.63105  ORF Transcript_40160/g.63105 Transcript_40160/m.63105 type:complete len:103 (-) Transcript_40160:5-313(-)